jgi:polar amino acid transport system substrate-binding protein
MMLRPLSLLLGVSLAIWATDTLVVLEADYPPFTYQDEAGRPAGFAMDLLAAMAKRDGQISLDITYLPFPRALATASEAPGRLITCLSRTEERSAQFAWIGPIYTSRISLYRRADRPELQIDALDQLGTRTIGVAAGYSIINDLLADGVPRNQIDEINPESRNVAKLFAGRIDYFAANDWVIAHHLTGEGRTLGDVTAVLPLDQTTDTFIGIQRQTDPGLIARLQAALEALRADGSYAALTGRYLR